MTVFHKFRPKAGASGNVKMINIYTIMAKEFTLLEK
jgi:hypothetical protein